MIELLIAAALVMSMRWSRRRYRLRRRYHEPRAERLLPATRPPLRSERLNDDMSNLADLLRQQLEENEPRPPPTRVPGPGRAGPG